jgi:hypothetical protein
MHEKGNPWTRQHTTIVSVDYQNVCVTQGLRNQRWNGYRGVDLKQNLANSGGFSCYRP